MTLTGRESTGASGCKGCERDIRLSEERIRKMVDQMAGKFACVSEAQYKLRLSACSSCDALLEGHTCKYCGCIVQVRAKLAERNCPHPSGALWHD